MTPEERAMLAVLKLHEYRDTEFNRAQMKKFQARRDELEAFAQAIREAIAEEREECAKIAEYSWEINPGDNIYALSSIIAKAIRRPGKEQG